MHLLQTRTRAFLLATACVLIAFPTAAAASAPGIGHFEWASWAGGLLVAAGTVMLAILVKPLRGFLGGIAPVLVASPLLVGAALYGTAMVVNPEGALHPGGAGNAPQTGAVVAPTSPGTFNAFAYEPTSDVTLSVIDANTFAGFTATAKIYPAGQDPSAVVLGTAVPRYSTTLTSGTGTLSGVQVQTIGCSEDIYTDASGYYQTITPAVNLCVAKNTNDNNDIAPPSLLQKAIGTVSMAKTDTSLTCSAGSSCTYTIIVRNSADHTYIEDPAVQFTNVANATLDSVDSTNCQLQVINGVSYVTGVGHTEIGPLGTWSCTIHAGRAAGSSGGSFTLTTDDLFQDYKATAFPTSSVIRSASSASATVTFA